MAEYSPILTPETARRLNVAINEGNSEGDTEFARDMQIAPRSVLERKYGTDVADSRRTLNQDRNELLRIESRTRTPKQILGDAALTGVDTFQSMVGGIAGASMAGYGEGLQAINPEWTGLSSFAADFVATSGRWSDALRGAQSDKLSDRLSVSNVEARLDKHDHLTQFKTQTNDNAEAN